MSLNSKYRESLHYDIRLIFCPGDYKFIKDADILQVAINT